MKISGNAQPARWMEQFINKYAQAQPWYDQQFDQQKAQSLARFLSQAIASMQQLAQELTNVTRGGDMTAVSPTLTTVWQAIDSSSQYSGTVLSPQNNAEFRPANMGLGSLRYEINQLMDAYNSGNQEILAGAVQKTIQSLQSSIQELQEKLNMISSAGTPQ